LSAILLIIIVFLTGCASQANNQKVPVKNGFETNGNGRISWFKLTPEDFIASVNKLATTKGYQNLILLDNDKSNKSDMYSFNGDTWYIIAKAYNGESDPKDARNQVYKIQLSLFANDEDRAKMNGFYMNTMIDMFNPGMADKVTDILYVYKDAPEDTPDVRQIVCGNVKYSYVYSKSSTPEFYIEPDKVQVESKGNVSPIKPE